MELIPVFEPYLIGTEWKFVKDALDKGHVSGTSPTISEFEKKFAEVSGRKYAVAAANGTVTLHLATLALGLKPGDEVILPDFTIISDALAIALCGAKPVFVDVSPKDYCIDSSKIKAAITERTRGIIAVHMYGQVCDMDFLVPFAKEHGLWLIEDAAQAHEAKWHGKQVGTFGAITSYSFYANKLITTGEGGAVTTDDEELYRRLLIYRNLGFDPDPSKRYIHAFFTNNYRMSSLQAAMGLAQLEMRDTLAQKRRDVRNLYREAMGEKPAHYSLAISDPRSIAAFWMCALCLNEDSPWDVIPLQKALYQKGIETRRFFFPLHQQPALDGMHDQKTETFPVSESLFDRGLYLPSSSLLTKEQVQYIIHTLHQLLSEPPLFN